MKAQNNTAVEAYRIVWLFVMFDLPVRTGKERKHAARFRKDLLQDGFTMLQFSVYTRHCPSKENAAVHIGRIEDATPRKGHVSILRVTDKQFSQIVNVDGPESIPLQRAPAQLEFL